MEFGDSNLAIWISAIIQTLGLVCLVLARISERSRHHAVYLVLFVTCLLLVGMTTMLSLRCGSCFGIYSGFTLGAMIVGSTCDFRAARSRAGASSG
jgi:hypothetical protein